MGKFKYSMQNILDIKIKLETQAKNEFSEANRAYLIEKEKLEELFKKRAVYEAALKEQLSGSLNISEINICKKNINSLKSAIRTQLMNVKKSTVTGADMNRFMKKFKAVYCNASFIFAIAVLMVTISLCIFYPDSVNASQSPSPSGDISTNDVTNDLDDVKSLDSGDKNLADATSDSTNGLNIYYNNESGSLSTPVRMFLVLTVLSLAPSILIMLTSFTRIIIVLHFVRTAIGTQTAPPNQVLVGLALFLTLFIMWPTFSQVNEKAIKSLDEGKITQQEAIKEAEGPFREFMYGQTQTKDIKLFVDISGDEYDDYDDVPFTTLVPAFILSELRTAFILGFLIYIPFIVIDMVVSSVLMSMGMMMLPPTTISMPFKVLLFILADGWDLVIGNLVKTFY